MAESVEAKRHGFVVDTVEVPSIPHPPAGILPFLDASSIRHGLPSCSDRKGRLRLHGSAS